MSLGDFWDNQVPDEWRTEALNMIRQCRNLDRFILTKRPQNIIEMLMSGLGQRWKTWSRRDGEFRRSCACLRASIGYPSCHCWSRFICGSGLATASKYPHNLVRMVRACIAVGPFDNLAP
jgi:hypothetical protein